MADSKRTPAKGSPAPFTQEQIDALVRGKPTGDVAGLIERHPRAQIPAGRSKRKAAPMPLTEDDLALIATSDALPDELARRLDASTTKARGKQPARRRSKGRPGKRPPH